jgi:heat shock protein HslJ
MHRSLALGLVLVAVLASVLAACDADGPPASPIDGHPTTLAGTSWVLAAIGGISTAGPNPPTIAFDATQAQGNGGCNHFGGRYRYNPATGELRFDEIGMTAMACAEGARNNAETAFVGAIGQPFLIATLQSDGRLVLASPAGARLDLVRVGPAVTD